MEKGNRVLVIYEDGSRHLGTIKAINYSRESRPVKLYGVLEDNAAGTTPEYWEWCKEEELVLIKDDAL